MQKLTVSINDNFSVELSSESVKEIIEQASFWSSLPKVCPLCKSLVTFTHRQTKDGDNYWGMACLGQTKHESNFGVYKNTERGLYYKREWHESFHAVDKQDAAQQNAYNQQTQTKQDDESSVELITERQNKMIYAVTMSLGLNQEDECQKMFNCSVRELSKRGASDFITYLKQREEDASRQGQQPSNSSSDQKHAPGCTCEKCEIPF